MTAIYLHHYENSPFAEKIRRVLAFKELPWHSVLQPAIMPKDDLVALTGGYRRIPVLQIGNDVYCDTPLICDVLELLQPDPSLYPKASQGIARVVAQWADTHVFAAGMAYNFSPTGAASFFKSVTPEFANAFAQDRKAMRSGAPRMPPSEATPAYREYLRRVNDMLANHQFVCGDTPSVADFAVYNPLWFTRRIDSIASILSLYSNILSWMDRIAALGNQQRQEASPEQALEACKASSSSALLGAFVDEHGVALGSSVEIVAESFGTEATAGTLVSATETRLVIEHHNARAGTVRVHFPRVGFVLRSR